MVKFDAYEFPNEANYEPAYEDGTVTVSGKIVPVVTEMPTAHWIIEGKSLATSTLSGGVACVDDQQIEGKFEWADPTIVPADEADDVVQEFTAVFKPTDTVRYAPAEFSVPVKVDTLPDLSEEGYTTVENVQFVLASAGLGTIGNVTSTDEYAAFRAWVLGLGTGAAEKRANKNAQYAYLSFALDQNQMITSDILGQNKLHVKACGVIEGIVEEQEIRAGAITVEFVNADGEPIKVGENATAERLAKAYGALGAFTLEGGWNPEASCTCSNFARTEDGDVQYHVVPQQEGVMAKQYFFCAKLYPDCDALKSDKE